MKSFFVCIVVCFTAACSGPTAPSPSPDPRTTTITRETPTNPAPEPAPVPTPAPTPTPVPAPVPMPMPQPPAPVSPIGTLRTVTVLEFGSNHPIEVAEVSFDGVYYGQTNAQGVVQFRVENGVRARLDVTHYEHEPFHDSIEWRAGDDSIVIYLRHR